MPVKNAKKSTSTSVEVKHSIPMPEQTKKSKMSNLINSRRKKVVANKDIKEEERSTIEISEETQKRFVQFASAKELFDIFEQNKKEQTNGLYDDLFEKYKDCLWDKKTQPATPKIVVHNNGKVDAKGQFIVQTGSKIKINMPAVGEDECPEEVMQNALVDLGVRPESAAELVEKEVSFVPEWSLNFTDLLHGTTEKNVFYPASEAQLKASEALFQVIYGEDSEGNELNSKEKLEILKSIDDSGWNQIRNNVDKHTSYSPSLVDSSKFLDRVCNYAETREEWDAILTMFKPVHFCSHVEFAVSDSVSDKTNRMQNEAKNVIEGKV